MSIRTVVVCEAQVPFVTGGSEYHVRALVDQLKKHGFSTELVRLPFKEYPVEEILPHAAAWRLIDLSESNGDPIDLVIGTKFPTYFVRHHNKVVWLIHQCRPPMNSAERNSATLTTPIRMSAYGNESST